MCGPEGGAGWEALAPYAAPIADIDDGRGDRRRRRHRPRPPRAGDRAADPQGRPGRRASRDHGRRGRHPAGDPARRPCTCRPAPARPTSSCCAPPRPTASWQPRSATRRRVVDLGGADAPRDRRRRWPTRPRPRVRRCCGRRAAANELGCQAAGLGRPRPEEALAAAEEGRVKAIVLLGADPVGDWPGGERWRAALGRCFFALQVTTFQDGSTGWATTIVPGLRPRSSRRARSPTSRAECSGCGRRQPCRAASLEGYAWAAGAGASGWRRPAADAPAAFADLAPGARRSPARAAIGRAGRARSAAGARRAPAAPPAAPADAAGTSWSATASSCRASVDHSRGLHFQRRRHRARTRRRRGARRRHRRPGDACLRGRRGDRRGGGAPAAPPRRRPPGGAPAVRRPRNGRRGGAGGPADA